MAFSLDNSGTARKAGKHGGSQAEAPRRSAIAGKGGSLAPASESAAARVTAEKAVARRRKAEAQAKASGAAGAVRSGSAPSGSPVGGSSRPDFGGAGKGRRSSRGAGVDSGVERSEAQAARPTKRSARGSETAAREKREQRGARRASGGLKGAIAGIGSARMAASTAGSPRAARRSGADAAEGDVGKDRATQRALMKYAADNRAVTWVYDFTTGPSRHFFYLIVIALVVLGAYFPVRDFYVAFRTEQILKEQNAIQDAYNETLGREVEGLLSEEGVKDAARKDFGMVMPGEQTITVEGLDEDGQPVTVDVGDQASSEEGGAGEAKDPATANGAASKRDDEVLKGADATKKDAGASDGAAVDSGKTPTTSAEVEAAERAVLENSAWYWKVLDTLFGFTGADGMAIVSTGDGK